MSYMHPAAVEHLRKRWTRPDAYRFAPPGSPEARPPWKRVETASADAVLSAAEQDAFEHELLHLRWLVKSMRLELALRRFQEKYSPDQQRVPAGNPDGGQWTSGTDGQSADRTKLTDFSAARRAGPPRAPMTAQQQARLDIAAARAREAVARVQQLDPNWRPTDTLTDPNNNEAFVRAKEDIVREADKRFMALSLAGQSEPFPMQNPQNLADALKPSGQFVGSREFSGSSNVRTISPEQFETIRLTLMGGARQIESRDDYDGVLYRRQDGSIFGLRLSADHGLTLDILRSSDPVIKDGFRIHQR